MDIRPNLKELKTTTANGSEKAWIIVTQKVNSRCFQVHRLYSNSFNASNVVILSGVESRRTVYLSSQNEKENRCFMCSRPP